MIPVQVSPSHSVSVPISHHHLHPRAQQMMLAEGGIGPGGAFTGASEVLFLAGRKFAVAGR